MKIALFGGSFDPPHIGHMMACYYVLSTMDIDEVWIVPSYRHPFEKESLDYNLRVKMCELSVSLLKDKVRVMRLEEELGARGEQPVYTIDLLKYVKERFPDNRFYFVIGSDILLETEHWKDFDKIEHYAKLIILIRRGVDTAEDYKSVLPDISSSIIRDNIGKNIPIKGLVTKEVLGFIEENNLYR